MLPVGSRRLDRLFYLSARQRIERPLVPEPLLRREQKGEHHPPALIVYGFKHPLKPRKARKGLRRQAPGQPRKLGQCLRQQRPAESRKLLRPLPIPLPAL